MRKRKYEYSLPVFKLRALSVHGIIVTTPDILDISMVFACIVQNRRKFSTMPQSQIAMLRTAGRPGLGYPNPAQIGPRAQQNFFESGLVNDFENKFK